MNGPGTHNATGACPEGIEPPRCGGCCGEGDPLPSLPERETAVFAWTMVIAIPCGIFFALGVSLGYLLWGVA